jgi:hypothetical protein
LLPAALAIVLCCAATALGWRYSPAALAENGWVEWLQVVLLLTTAAVVFHASRMTRGCDVLRLGLALLCLTMAVREVDIDSLGSSPAWANAERIIRAGVLGLWCSLLVYASLTSRRLLAKLGAWVPDPSMQLVLLAGSCFVFAQPFDQRWGRGWLGDSTSLWAEESLELAGAAILGMGAAAMHRKRKRAVNPSLPTSPAAASVVSMSGLH